MKITQPTYTQKSGDIERSWILIDARGLVLGRLASFVAHRLRGKHLPTFTPHMDGGDCIVILNAKDIALTGKKWDQRFYHRYTGYPGGIKTTTPKELVARGKPERILENAVRRMLKRTPLGAQAMRRLRIYADGEHPHAAQMPKEIAFADMNSKNTRGASGRG